MHIDLLYVPNCPNLGRTRVRLQEALDAAGVDASVRAVEVTSSAAAAETGMRGSPTILINGHDPFATETESASLSCRLYAVGERMDGAPTVAQLIEALAG